MKERPILFSGEMVRAILDGRKTQTRRVIKPQPPKWIDAEYGNEFRERAPHDLEDYETGQYNGFGFEWGSQPNPTIVRSPYGQPGDRLWVRETWADPYYRTSDKDSEQVVYKADLNWQPGVKWKPSIHMPRWASRIILEITDIKVERLQDISEEDAIAEGYKAHAEPICTAAGQYRDLSAREAFLEGDWAQGIKQKHGNLWLWVIEFRKL